MSIFKEFFTKLIRFGTEKEGKLSQETEEAEKRRQLKVSEAEEVDGSLKKELKKLPEETIEKYERGIEGQE